MFRRIVAHPLVENLFLRAGYARSTNANFGPNVNRFLNATKDLGLSGEKKAEHIAGIIIAEVAQPRQKFQNTTKIFVALAGGGVFTTLLSNYLSEERDKKIKTSFEEYKQSVEKLPKENNEKQPEAISWRKKLGF